jgi:hypothetical protein
LVGPSEGADDDITAVLYRARNLSNVRNTLIRCRQKMKDSAVMPNIVTGWRQITPRDVSNQPVNPPEGFAQSLLVRINRSARDIEHRDVLIAASEKVVDQRGFASSDIDD